MFNFGIKNTQNNNTSAIIKKIDGNPTVVYGRKNIITSNETTSLSALGFCDPNNNKCKQDPLAAIQNFLSLSINNKISLFPSAKVGLYTDASVISESDKVTQNCVTYFVANRTLEHYASTGPKEPLVYFLVELPDSTSNSRIHVSTMLTSEALISDLETNLYYSYIKNWCTAQNIPATYEPLFWVGYNAGLDDGIAQGTEIGLANGKKLGYGVGFFDGNSTGFFSGFKTGEEIGFINGEAQGIASGEISGYKKGYIQGGLDSWNNWLPLDNKHFMGFAVGFLCCAGIVATYYYFKELAKPTRNLNRDNVSADLESAPLIPHRRNLSAEEGKEDHRFTKSVRLNIQDTLERQEETINLLKLENTSLMEHLDNLRKLENERRTEKELEIITPTRTKSTQTHNIDIPRSTFEAKELKITAHPAHTESSLTYVGAVLSPKMAETAEKAKSTTTSPIKPEDKKRSPAVSPLRNIGDYKPKDSRKK